MMPGYYENEDSYDISQTLQGAEWKKIISRIMSISNQQALENQD
jgi:hypothetical protein